MTWSNYYSVFATALYFFATLLATMFPAGFDTLFSTVFATVRDESHTFLSDPTVHSDNGVMPLLHNVR